MLRALTDAGKAGKIHFIGFDTSQKLIDALAQGQFEGLVVQNPFGMGELSVNTIVNYIRNPEQQPTKRIDTGIVVATPENMNEPKIQSLLKSPLAKYLGEE